MFAARPAGSRSGPTAIATASLLAVVLSAPAAASSPAPVEEPSESTPAVLYRVFLRDEGLLVSYGEFARLGNRVILSIPVGGTEAAPVLHLLTIAEEEVDWERTDAYAHAARAERYAATRGEVDYARLTREVTATLYQVGLVSDAAERLALAERARRQLVEWPRQHHGYRAEEVARLAVWLDQVVSELRIAAGYSSFDLALVAPLPAPAVDVLLPPPSLRDRVESALLAARRTAEPGERVSLLRAVLEVLQPTGPDDAWMTPLRTRASTTLAAELRVDRLYVDLTRRTLARATTLARNADVRGLEALVQSVLDEDRQLQRARPAELSALLSTLDLRLDAARRLRLAHDAWALRRSTVLRYWTDIRQPLDRLIGVRSWLTDVRQLAGPAPGSVRRLAEYAALATEELGRLQPPSELASVHATFGAAASLASRASAARLDAIRSGSMDTAWQASSAAAGSLLLLEQALDELRRITYAPAPTLP